VSALSHCLDNMLADQFTKPGDCTSVRRLFALASPRPRLFPHARRSQLDPRHSHSDPRAPFERTPRQRRARSLPSCYVEPFFPSPHPTPRRVDGESYSGRENPHTPRGRGGAGGGDGTGLECRYVTRDGTRARRRYWETDGKPIFNRQRRRSL